MVVLKYVHVHMYRVGIIRVSTEGQEFLLLGWRACNLHAYGVRVQGLYRNTRICRRVFMYIKTGACRHVMVKGLRFRLARLGFRRRPGIFAHVTRLGCFFNSVTFLGGLL